MLFLTAFFTREHSRAAKKLIKYHSSIYEQNTEDSLFDFLFSEKLKFRDPILWQSIRSVRMIIPRGKQSFELTEFIQIKEVKEACP